LTNERTVQSDQEENKSEQALQIIGHVVAKSYVNKRSICGLKRHLIINHTSWIFDVGIIILLCIYYLLLLFDNEENLESKQEQYFTFVRMGNLRVLLSNTTPLVSRFFSKMAKKHQF
jgi:hypothetical protein